MILCFGRNENQINALSSFLRASGYATLTCFDAADAVQALSAHRISAVMGDEMLVSPAGQTLRQRVFELDPPVPLIYLPQFLQACKEPGCAECQTLLSLISTLRLQDFGAD